MSQPRSRTPLVLGMTIIAITLVFGIVGATSAHLSRMRLLDAADAAASVQRLAVLLEAGVTPPRAWGLLADSGVELSKALCAH